MTWVLLTLVAVFFVSVLFRHRRPNQSIDPNATVSVWNSRRHTAKTRAALNAASDVLRTRDDRW